MIKKLALVSLAVVLVLGISMIVSYALPPSDEAWTPGPSLVTLEITRHGQKTFKATTLSSTAVTAINHDTGLAYGFVPSVDDQKKVSVGFYALGYNSEEDAWELPKDQEPLEILEVSSQGPSFTTALEENGNYKINLVSIEPIESSGR